MKWFYEADGEQQGPVTPAGLDALIQEGKVGPKTRVWRDGMADWQPLYEARPELDPANLKCARCGDFLPAARMASIRNRWYCPHCAALVRADEDEESAGSDEDDSAEEQGGPAWEVRGSIGFVNAALQTIGGVLARPGETFGGMRRTGGVGAPLSFAVLMGVLGQLCLAFYIMMSLRSGGAQNIPPAFRQVLGPQTLERWASPSSLFSTAIMAPVNTLMHVFLLAGATHLILWMLGGVRTFEVTLRVVCYGYGAAMALAAVPFCGPPLVVIWLLAVLAVGLARGHEVDRWHGVMAVLLPIAALFMLFVFSMASGGRGF